MHWKIAAAKIFSFEQYAWENLNFINVPQKLLI